MPPAPMTVETIIKLLEQKERSDSERHQTLLGRLDAIDDKQAEANGRLRKVETNNAVLTERMDGIAPKVNGGLAGGALALLALAGEFIWRLVSSK